MNTYFFHYRDRSRVYAISWLHTCAVRGLSRRKGVKKPFRHLTATRVSFAYKKDFFHLDITSYFNTRGKNMNILVD